MSETVRSRVWVVMPLALAAGLVALFLVMMARGDRSELPSMLVAKPAPAFALTGLRPGEAPPTLADLTAPGVKLVNFWASWCGPCREEHPELMRLRAEGVSVIGVNYKDRPENALGFLAGLGDPFAKLGADDKGRTGIEWGIYGIPETFVVDGAGRVLLRYPGALTPEIFAARIAPLLGR